MGTIGSLPAEGALRIVKHTSRRSNQAGGAGDLYPVGTSAHVCLRHSAGRPHKVPVLVREVLGWDDAARRGEMATRWRPHGAGPNGGR